MEICTQDLTKTILHHCTEVKVSGNVSFIILELFNLLLLRDDYNFTITVTGVKRF